jgi:hypothetical protein
VEQYITEPEVRGASSEEKDGSARSLGEISLKMDVVSLQTFTKLYALELGIATKAEHC